MRRNTSWFHHLPSRQLARTWATQHLEAAGPRWFTAGSQPGSVAGTLLGGLLLGVVDLSHQLYDQIPSLSPDTQQG
jgi:hypothetical protein